MFFLVYGSDTFRSRKKLTELREHFWHTRDPSKLNHEHLMWPKDDFQKVHTAVNSPPFLADKKFIMLEDFLDAPKDIQEKLADVMNAKNNASIVVFYESVEKEKLQKTVLYPLLVEQKFSVELSSMSVAEAQRWITAQLTEKKLRMQPRVISMFLSAVGTDTSALINELEKAVAYAHATASPEITADIVSLLTTPAQEESVFVLIDALLGGKPAQALSLFETMVSSENDIPIIALLTKQFRTLAALSQASKTDMPALAKTLAVHPYVLQKSSQLIRKRPSFPYAECYTQLLSIEETRKTSRIDTKPLLQQFIFQLH